MPYPTDDWIVRALLTVKVSKLKYRKTLKIWGP